MELNLIIIFPSPHHTKIHHLRTPLTHTTHTLAHTHAHYTLIHTHTHDTNKHTISAKFSERLSNRSALKGITFLSLFVYKYAADTSFIFLSCTDTDYGLVSC